LTFYNICGKVLVLRVRKENKKKMTFELVEHRKAYVVQFWGTRRNITSPVFKSKQAAANYVVREGYRVVEDLRLLEIDLDKLENGETAVVERYSISTAGIGFRMSESDNHNEWVFNSIGQNERQKNAFYSFDAQCFDSNTIAKLSKMANV
jgi:hypothetical protein